VSETNPACVREMPRWIMFPRTLIALSTLYYPYIQYPLGGTFFLILALSYHRGIFKAKTRVPFGDDIRVPLSLRDAKIARGTLKSTFRWIFLFVFLLTEYVDDGEGIQLWQTRIICENRDTLNRQVHAKI
jgi:hypothetical protein